MANSSKRERWRSKAREMEGYNAEFGESVRDDEEEEDPEDATAEWDDVPQHLWDNNDKSAGHSGNNKEMEKR